MAENEEPVEQRTVIGVGSSSRFGKNASVSRLLEEAQSRAILQAMEDGVGLSDTQELLRRKAVARAQVLDALKSSSLTEE